jgi:twinkle protein
MFKNIVSDIDFQEYSELHTLVYEVSQLAELKDDLKAFSRGEFFAKGVKLPWQKTHQQVELRPAELTLWGGSTGHGKSLIMGQVILSIMEQGKKCLIASFEMPPVSTLFRMARQATGMKHPTELSIDAFAKWGNEHLYIYKHTGMVEANKVLAMCRYASEQLKIEHLVIDNLMTCVNGEDDYNAQKNFVATVKSIALSTGMHIHLICHVRKVSSEKEIPIMSDIKGSSAVTSFADNVFLVWKNAEKAQKVAENYHHFDRIEPDAILRCTKNRNGESTPLYKLWFDYKSQQFIEEADTPIHNYLGDK